MTIYTCTDVHIDNNLILYTDVHVDNNLILYVDGNSKITAGNGSYEAPKPNAFSLPHVSTCPGATSKCISTCYIYGLQQNAPEIYKKYAQNERNLHRILMTYSGMVRTAEAFGKWILENCSGGFRWHVSGDIISDRHAQWIKLVVINSFPINHWIYTRTLNVVPILTGLSNLAVNISADADNYLEARIAKNIRVCYLTLDGSLPDDLEDGDVIFPDYSLRGQDLDRPIEHEWWRGLSPRHKRMVCPADFFGQSERHRCGVCKKCLSSKVY